MEIPESVVYLCGLDNPQISGKEAADDYHHFPPGGDERRINRPISGAILASAYSTRNWFDEIARRMHVDPHIVFQFDEVSHGLVQSLIWDWRAHVNEDVYARYLREAINRIAAEYYAVIIGRGANFVLHCSKCLHVRIVAPLGLRTEIYRSYFEVQRA